MAESGTGIGRKIERIREIRGMKQDVLASILGISQQAVSKMEQSDAVDDERLSKVAEALGVSVEAIKNFSEENVIYNVQNNYDNAMHNVNYQSNQLDKIVDLYERLLSAEREKIMLLERMLKHLEARS